MTIWAICFGFMLGSIEITYLIRALYAFLFGQASFFFSQKKKMTAGY